MAARAQKRKGGAGGAGEAEEQPRQQRAKRGSRSPAQQEQRVIEMMQARAFWDTVSTPYLLAWAKDYEDPAAQALPDERGALIAYLVETDGVQIPEGEVLGEQLKELKKSWKKSNKG